MESQLKAFTQLKLAVLNTKVLAESLKDKLSDKEILELANMLAVEQIKILNNDGKVS